ncbi:ApaG protein [Thermonema lapsum]|jgi:ApaG protein|uniref:ApaG protein n=1 Tax=Thermonema lapsum TaxID=28195 RepID=A0A846MR51_9BACT|nr:Co2+/Mg2+ efflux protein ApaG [Thermonema lapsum]NIK73911.1 ApaG protein [Thermonema lapsum]
MVTQVTEGVRVSVLTEYQPDYSSPLHAHYVFVYRIIIENQSPYTIQLMRRHWFVFDSNWMIKEVEGTGVRGKQLIIEPGQKHEYVSGCNLRTDIGKMYGYYLMRRLLDGKEFHVQIPQFTLITPYRLN